MKEVLEEFTCRLCGVKEYSEVNNARYELFCKSPPDPQGLLPTQDALFLHMDRANYQCYERKSALTNENRQVPDGHGWLMKEGVLPVEWCRQKPEPDAILSFVTCTRKKNKCQTGSCGCFAIGYACVNVCGCRNCENEGSHSRNDEDEDSLNDEVSGNENE